MTLAADQLDWVEHYEALRAHALGEAPVAFVPLGLGVLHRRGLAAWMAVEAGVRREPPIQVEGVGGPIVPSQSPELVRLLAGTALLVAGGRRA